MSYNTDDLGYSKLLTKPNQFDISRLIENETPASVNNFYSSVAPSSIGSGELAGNLNIVGGYLQSSNFASDSNGWKFDAVGNLEANSATIRGSIYATSGLIGGWVVDDDGLYYSGSGTPNIRTAETVGIGSDGVLLDANGIKVYDSVLGVVVNLPSDGSAPSFASGTINETIFEISTNSVLRTSETVGDGTANSAGVLIDNTGIFACEADQTLAAANVRITSDGNAYFQGDVYASTITASNIGDNDIDGELNVVDGFLKSSNFLTGVNGWKFDAVGNLEANSATIRGSIYATTGLIGGWTIDSNKIYQDNSYLSSSGYISFGATPPTEYEGQGIWMGYGTGAQLSLYSDASNYLKWSGTNLLVKSANFEIDDSGNIIATGGEIGGFTIDSNSLYGSTIKTSESVAEGSDGVIMDTDGLRGYSATLGKVFDLPTDGSAPSFLSGTIEETIFEINTNAVLRTSATVGDGSADSAGILINNTGLYACEANQTLSEGNVRITALGNGYFKGTVNASTIVSSDIYGTNIHSAMITGATLRTAESGQRIEINTEGMQLLAAGETSAYGDSDFLYGNSLRLYGTGVLAYVNNSTKKIPFYVQAEQDVGDMHMVNRTDDPTGKAEIGDLCVVDKRLKICVEAGTPGGWEVVGAQEAVSSPSPSISPSES